MKSNNGILTEKEIQARTKFWNKKQFRTWSKKELERTSTDMQNLSIALKEFSLDEIETIRKLNRYGFDTYFKYKTGPKYIVRMADQRGFRLCYFDSTKNF